MARQRGGRVLLGQALFTAFGGGADALGDGFLAEIRPFVWRLARDRGLHLVRVVLTGDGAH